MKKSKLKKAECVGDNYKWVVGKGCFENAGAPKSVPKDTQKPASAKKVKLLKKDCDPTKYDWIVGKGCFEKLQTQAPQTPPRPAAKPPVAKPSVKDGARKKLKLLKKDCDPTKYDWIVGKGCFEKLQTAAVKPPVTVPPVTVPPVTVPPVTVCNGTTYIDKSEFLFVKGLNCLELPLAQVRFILGPCIFYEFELGNRKLYLFGEVHQAVSRDIPKLRTEGANTYNTLSFQAFVHSLATQNPEKTYDLMFENVYFANDFLWYSNSSVFNQITREFINCIDPDKRRYCPYKNLRTHYVDYRRAIPRPYKHATQQEIQEEIETLLKTPGKVLKQINAIKDEKIKNSFIDFFYDFVKNDSLSAGRSRVAVMDVYAMARILRDFDSKKKNGVGAFEGTAQNVIYYAGATHIKNFVKFLTDYLNLKPKAKIGNFIRNVTYRECQSFVDMGDLTKTMV